MITLVIVTRVRSMVYTTWNVTYTIKPIVYYDVGNPNH